jgi:hypothetical protein
MLQDAHKCFEAMSMAVTAVKDEQWADAERRLLDVQRLTSSLLQQLGDKQREAMMAPKPDRGDRG